MTLCCPLASRPDIRLIDAALARGDGYRKVRADADVRGAELGLPPIENDWAVRRHREHVLARMGTSDLPADIEPETPPGKPPCCVVAERPDADEIDADLRAGVTHRKVHAAAKARYPELDVNETTIYRHKGHLARDENVGVPARPLAATPVPLAATPAPLSATPAPLSATSAPLAATSAPLNATPAPLSATSAPLAATSAPLAATPAPLAATPAPLNATPAVPLPAPKPAKNGVISSASRLTAPENAPGASGASGERTPPPEPRSEEPASRAPARAITTTVPTPEVTTKVLDQIAKLLVAGSWNGLSTVEALSDKYGLPVAEVQRLHALAAAKVKAARGPLAAQLEAAIAATHWIFKDETENAARYREEADKLFASKEYAGARAASKIATASHRLALEARRHLDDLTVKKPPAVAIHVAVMANPDFAAAFDVIAMAIDEFFGPGAAARVEEALGVWEEVYAVTKSDAKAREAVALWLAEQRDAITVAGEEVEPEG